MSVANDITWHECVFKEFHSQKQRAPAMPQLLVIYVQMEILDKCATEKISSDIFNGLYCLKVRKRLRIRQWLRILSRISGHVSFNIVYWGGECFQGRLWICRTFTNISNRDSWSGSLKKVLRHCLLLFHWQNIVICWKKKKKPCVKYIFATSQLF